MATIYTDAEVQEIVRHRDILQVRYNDEKFQNAALEAQLDALLVGLQVENTALLKTKGPEYFSKLAECIADDSQNKYAEIAALVAELEAAKVQLAKEQQSVNELVAAVQEMGRENKRLRTAAQAIVAAADKRDTDEIYRNMRGLRAALAGKEE